MDNLEYEYINNCCMPGINKLFVDINGGFWACERAVNLIPLGSTESKLDFNNAKSIINLYQNDCQTRCIQCNNVRFCDLCYISVKRNNNLDFTRKDQICKNRLKHLQILLYIFCSIMEKNELALNYLDQY